MKDFVVCKRCQHTTMQVLVSELGEVEVLCSTCRKRVLGFFGDDEFADILKDSKILQKKKQDELRRLN